MCGISVCVDLASGRKNEHGKRPFKYRHAAEKCVRLERSLESLRHRGPDAKGVWVSTDGQVALGHVRLSTRDLSDAGSQPLHSGDDGDDIHAVVNGELYYDDSLRDDLAHDYRFRSTSDSEMVIPLYKKYGQEFMRHLRGEFSAVIYDGKRKLLIAFRDRFGVKPLYYGVFNGQLLISSQCKGVAKLLENQGNIGWDVKAVCQGGGTLGSRTLFEGIRKFPPAHFLALRVGQEQDLSFHRYWSIKYPLNHGHSDTRSVESLKTELHTRLIEAVRLRLLSSDVKVGILLSGGVDSSAVAGMAAAIWKEQRFTTDGVRVPPPVCFTITFPDAPHLDESATAQRTAEHIGLPFEKVIVTEQMLADEFDDTLWLGEVPIFDLQHIAKKILSRHISRRGFKVVLNGDGSDELFGGYTFFVADRLREDDRHRSLDLQEVTSSQRESLRKDHEAQIKWFGIETDGDKEVGGLAAELQLSPWFRKLAIYGLDHSYLSSSVERSDPCDAILDTLQSEERQNMKSYHPLHRSMLAFIKSQLPNFVIAAISDGAEMAHSVESRPPLLDHHVAELAQTLPVDLLIHLEKDKPTEKWIFRETVKPYVTEEVYQKRKHPFSAPFRFSVGGPIHRKLSSLITKENIAKMGFIEYAKCKDLVYRSFAEQNESLFRQAIYLAQMITIGLQFDVETWTPPVMRSWRSHSISDSAQLTRWSTSPYLSCRPQDYQYHMKSIPSLSARRHSETISSCLPG